MNLQIARRNFRCVLLPTFAAAVSCCVAASAQTPAATPSATPNLTGIAHVAIRVADLEHARDFFHKLGFEESFAMDTGGTPTEAFFKINDRQFIELYPRRDASSAVGFMHVCFEAADLNAVHQDYVNHGLAPNQVRRAGAGNLLFTLQGPDQPGPPSDLRGAATQNIEYTQYMPGSRHTLDRGQHLGPNRIADRIAGVGIPFADPAAGSNVLRTQAVVPARCSSVTGWGSCPCATLVHPTSKSKLCRLPSGSTDNVPRRLTLYSRCRTSAYRRSAANPRLGRKKNSRTLVIHDPEGDAIVFVEAH